MTDDTRPTGTDLICAERLRQTLAEGYTTEHDASHTEGQLAWAAACYAAPETVYRLWVEKDERGGRVTWAEPWPARALSRWRRPKVDRIRELVKAGALIAAEIDRLQAVSDG